VTFINGCAFPIGVESMDSSFADIIVCTLECNGTCQWNIPDAGWSGRFYRHNALGDSSGYPSATLAEFDFASQCSSGNCAWNWDWFDISIIPPLCPGSVMSYTGCVSYTGSDGYDVGMQMVPLSCPSQYLTCLTMPCDAAYGYPQDNSKTTVCSVLGDWVVTFCPAGSYVNLTPAEISETTQDEMAVIGAMTSGGEARKSSGLSTEAAIGLGVGFAILGVALVGLVVFIVKRREGKEIV